MSRSNRSKPTLRDVAHDSGVSLATASVVLNRSKRVHISEETRQRVLDAAEQLGYQPRSRKGSQSHDARRIAYVVNHVDKDISISSVNGAREVAWQHDYLLYVMSYGSDNNLKASIMEELEKGGFAGVIFASNVTREIEVPELPAHLPAVILNGYAKERMPWPTILPADLLGGHMATQHLIDRGYQRIAHISGEEWMDASRFRQEGYRRALVSNDRIVDESLIRRADWHTMTAYQETMSLMKLSSPPDALFIASDEMALGAYLAIRELGLKIPDDVAVVGYDNSGLSEELSPGLTTVELPYYEMGQLAAETLLNQLSGKASPLNVIKHEGNLVIRGSS